jgi:hypothetical protein
LLTTTIVLALQHPLYVISNVAFQTRNENKMDKDLQNAAHRYFSAHCFNAAWDLIDNSDRTPDEEEAMINLCHASLWHWSQRVDCTNRHRSIGYWQASRVYAVLRRADRARHYAELSLQWSGADDPFLTGYAYEALARAEAIRGDLQKMRDYLKSAIENADRISDADDRNRLIDDIKSIEGVNGLMTPEPV